MFLLKLTKRFAGQVHDGQRHKDRPISALCLAAAAISLGIALYISDGFYNPNALLPLSFAYVLCVLGGILRHTHITDKLAYRFIIFILTAGLSLQLYLLFFRGTGWQLGVLIPIGLVGLLFIKSETLELSWVRLILITSLLVPHFMIGMSVIRGLSNPNFDVYVYQMQSLDALLKGINPHTLTIGYNPGDEVNFNPSYIFDGRIHIGFPYPPLSLLLALPGYLLCGDYRYSNLAATTLSGFFIALARPSKVSFLAAGVFLFTPCMPSVLKMGWTEPYVILLFSATVFCACRTPRYLPWVLGLFFAVKQYAILAGLAVFLLPLESDGLKAYALLVGKALLLATAITLPLALWNVNGFISDVLILQFQQPFRMDALSYLVWLTYNTGVQPPSVIGFLMSGAAAALMVWRGARTPAGFAAAVSLIFFSFFAFNKQAFVNYYFFVVGAMCCAVAALGTVAPNKGIHPTRNQRVS
jgi:hypothetical protein